MRNLSVIASFVLLVTGVSGAQQAAAPVSTTPETAQPAQSINVPKVYLAGPDVTAPELLPLELGPFSSEKCKKKVKGKYVFSLLVDKDGRSREVTLLEPLGTELGQYATKIVEADRFKPGIRDGAPVTVRESIEVNIHTCVEQTAEGIADKTYRLRLISQPEQKFRELSHPMQPPASDENYIPPATIDGVPVYLIGNGVSGPVPLKIGEAEFSDEARRAKYQGICIVSVIIDAEGKPRNLHVVRGLGMGLDEKAMEAVSQYRFKPAKKDGVPVPVSIKIEVNFKLF
jgi:TonB family protein